MGVPQAPAEGTVRLSELLWGIDWNSAFPCELRPGIHAHVATSEEIVDFAREHFGSIFGETEQSGFLVEKSAARERYLKFACDGFLICHGIHPIAQVICNPVDWSTYYLRLAAVIPEYQGQDVIGTMVTLLCGVLTRAGVARFEFDTASSNARCMTLGLGLGFVVTGSTISERWGALYRFTRFLDTEVEDAYMDRFCISGRMHRADRKPCGGRGAPERH